MSGAVRLPPAAALIEAHAQEVALSESPAGLRDEGGLHSALARAENLIAYADAPSSIHDIAATAAFGIAKNHPFVDGNKRMALVCAYMILSMNGWRLDATERAIVDTVLALAAGELDVEGLARWLEQWSYPA
jgi:death on curing protein